MDAGTIEASGHFWLPEKPGDTTSGTLLINPDGSAELKLSDIVSGDLEYHASRMVQFGTLIPATRILGNASGIGDVTLEHCFANPMRFLHEFSERPQPTDYEVGHVLCGALWDQDEIVEFDSLVFSIEGLNEWIGESGFIFQDPFSRTGYGMKFTPPLDIELGSWNDLDISIRYTWQPPSIGPRVFDITASQQAHFRLDASTPLSFEHLFETAWRLRDFVSLGVGRNLLFTSMAGYANDLGRRIDGEFYRDPIKVHFRDTRQRDDDRIPYHSDMLFEFEAARKKSGSRFADWLESYNLHHEPIAQYFGVFEQSSVTWAQKLRSMFQVVETLFEQGMSDHVERKLPGAEVRRIVEKINYSFTDEPDVAEIVAGAFRNSNRLSARKKLEHVFSENLGICSDAPVIRAASRSVVQTRDELTHVAGADTFAFYMNHHASIKIDILDTIIRIWLLRLAGFDLDYALAIVEQRPTLWRNVAGLIKSKDQSLEQMRDEVWWKRPL